MDKAKLLLLKLIHLFAREVLLLKKLEIEETDIIKVGLVFSISNFFIAKRLWQIIGGVLAAVIWL